MDWGLAKVRRPRLRHSNIVLNQSEAEDSRGKKESAWHVLEKKLAAVVDYAVMQRNLRCMSGRSQMEDESAKTAFQSDAVNAGRPSWMQGAAGWLAAEIIVFYV